MVLFRIAASNFCGVEFDDSTAAILLEDGSRLEIPRHARLVTLPTGDVLVVED